MFYGRRWAQTESACSEPAGVALALPWPQAAIRESNAGTGLEVALELQRASFVLEPDCGAELPVSVATGMGRSPEVVFLQDGVSSRT